ncbi:MAG: hypothetical protein U0270_00265 [Labilithrix sp.]
MSSRQAGLLLASAIFLGGCTNDVGALPPLSSDGRVVFHEDVVNVSATFSDTAIVTEDRVVVPASMVGKIDRGSIVAGDRASTGTSNPYGFLRRVIDVQRDVPKEGQVTLLTTKAELADWIHSGRVDFGSPRSALTGKLVMNAPTTKSLEVRAEKVDKTEATDSNEASAETEFDADFGNTLKITNTSFKMNASFKGFIDVRREEGALLPRKVAMSASLDLAPAVAFDIELGIKGEVSQARSWKAMMGILPLPGAIPLTLRFTPEMKCTLSASGDGKLTVGANLDARSTVGFAGEAFGGDLDITNLSQAPTMKSTIAAKEVEGTANVAAECEVVAVLELLAFDSVGFTGRMGPSEKITATSCVVASKQGSKTGFTVVAERALNETIGVRVDIPLLDIDKQRDLMTFSQTIGEPLYLVGNKETCEAPAYDSCAGKPDGLHCSELVESSGYVCEGGQILKGLQCEDAGQKCVGGTPDAMKCQ